MLKKNIRARTDEAKTEKKRRILNAAREMFLDKGYAGTKIKTIADLAGVSTGTFYLYYKNKLEVYKALQEEGIDILSSMIDEAIEQKGLNCFERLSRIAEKYLEFYRRYGEYFEILAILSALPKELRETDSEISKTVNKKIFGLLKKIESVLAEGIRKKELARTDTWKATNVFWSMLDGLILLSERQNIENITGANLEDMTRHALMMVFKGIAAK